MQSCCNGANSLSGTVSAHAGTLLFASTLTLVLSVVPNPVRAFEQPQPQQTFDPGTLFENFFGDSPSAADAAVAKIDVSAAEERGFGETIVNEYLAQLRRSDLEVVDRGKDVDYLSSLVETLQPFMAKSKRYKSIKVYVVNSDKVDARSFPGGTLVFFRGLLEFADSEAAVVAIVGHELSHLDRGHQLLPLQRMKYFEQSINSGVEDAGPVAMMKAFRTMMAGFARPFRPEDESEADRDGAAWAFRAGYDPRELGKLFLNMQRHNGRNAVQVPPFLQTHPFNVDRQRAIEKQFVQLSRKQASPTLYVGRRNLKERITRAQREFPED